MEMQEQVLSVETIKDAIEMKAGAVVDTETLESLSRAWKDAITRQQLLEELQERYEE